MERFEALIERLPPCLHWHPDGEIRVVGRRISLFNILKSLDELGESPETIAENYELPPGLVREVIAFAIDHRPEVDPYMADYRAELERQYAEYTPSPAQLRNPRADGRTKGPASSARFLSDARPLRAR